MFKALLIFSLFLGSPPSLACFLGSDVFFTKEKVVELQKLYDHPFYFYATMAVINHGEVSFVEKDQPYLFSYTYDTSYGMPFPYPLLTLSNTNAAQMKYRNDALQTIAKAFSDGRHKLEPALHKKIIAGIEQEVAALDPRMRFFFILNDTSVPDNGKFLAFTGLHDVSKIDGITGKAFIEHDLAWRFPEREQQQEQIALLELVHAFNNPERSLRELAGLYFIAKEIATHIDAQFLRRNIPVVLRLQTTVAEGRERYFQRVWGFDVDPSAPSSNGLVIMRQSGESFVKRVGSNWNKFIDMFPDRGIAAVSPLYQPIEFQALVKREDRRRQNMYKFLPPYEKVDFPTFEKFLDGLGILPHGLFDTDGAPFPFVTF